MSPDRERLFFVGPGRAGLSLGYALSQEAPVDLVYAGRRPEPPAHPLFIQGTARYVYGLEWPGAGTTAVILSVPDDAVPETALRLGALGDAPEGCSAFHVSGALRTDVLAPLHERGYSVGSLHPLQSLSNPVTGADLLRGAHFAVAGEPQARSTAYRLLSHLGSPWLEVPAIRRPLYHAAAVLASNYVTVLLDVSRGLMMRAGVPGPEARSALQTLVEGTVRNYAGIGEGSSLTGPVQRGDVDTVRLHLRTLEPVERRLYAAMGLAALGVDSPELDDATVQTLMDLFEAER